MSDTAGGSSKKHIIAICALQHRELAQTAKSYGVRDRALLLEGKKKGRIKGGGKKKREIHGRGGNERNEKITYHSQNKQDRYRKVFVSLPS